MKTVLSKHLPLKNNQHVNFHVFSSKSFKEFVILEPLLLWLFLEGRSCWHKKQSMFEHRLYHQFATIAFFVIGWKIAEITSYKQTNFLFYIRLGMLHCWEWHKPFSIISLLLTLFLTLNYIISYGENFHFEKWQIYQRYKAKR